jgi:hypothetical protein
MFALDDEKSFKEAVNTFERLREAYQLRRDSMKDHESKHSPQSTTQCPFPTILIGNKEDIKGNDRFIELKRALRYADDAFIPYYETSVHHEEQILVVIEELVKLVIKSKRKRLVLDVTRSIGLQRSNMFSSSASYDEDKLFLKKFEHYSQYNV